MPSGRISTHVRQITELRGPPPSGVHSSGTAAECSYSIDLHLHLRKCQGRNPDQGARRTGLPEELLPDGIDHRPIAHIGEVNRYLQNVGEGRVRSNEDLVYVLEDLTALLGDIVSTDDAVLFVKGSTA